MHIASAFGTMFFLDLGKDERRQTLRRNTVRRLSLHLVARSPMRDQADLEKLFVEVGQTTTHEWVLYFAIYYSSWTGSMVLEKDKVFSEYD